MRRIQTEAAPTSEVMCSATVHAQDAIKMAQAVELKKGGERTSSFEEEEKKGCRDLAEATKGECSCILHESHVSCLGLPTAALFEGTRVCPEKRKKERERESSSAISDVCGGGLFVL